MFAEAVAMGVPFGHVLVKFLGFSSRFRISDNVALDKIQ